MPAKFGTPILNQSARLKLPVALITSRYTGTIEPGLSIGYRKVATDKPGTWIVRKWDDGKYSVINSRRQRQLGIADDFADADGDNVLAWPSPDRSTGPAQDNRQGRLAVRDAAALYVAHLKVDHRTPMAIENAEYVIGKHIFQPILPVLASPVYQRSVITWREAIVAQAGDDPEMRAAASDSQSNVDNAASDLEFRRQGKEVRSRCMADVGKYKGVERARERYLSIEEAQRLVQCCDDNLRPLVQAALQTGCRYSELAALEARDLDLRAGTIKIRQSKNGHARNVLLSARGRDTISRISAARSGSERLFTRSGGEPGDLETRHRRSAPPASVPAWALIVCFTV